MVARSALGKNQRVEKTDSKSQGRTQQKVHEQMPVMNESVRKVFEAYKLHPEFLGLSFDDLNQRGALDSTLLHIASRTGHLEHVKVLLEAGADVNAKGDLDNTPLHDAALCGQAKAVELLLSLGANPALKNEFGQTALDVAVLGKKDGVCEVLRSRSTKRRR
jgi:ankyrin repeat protein